jgi:hypothetical protein
MVSQIPPLTSMVWLIYSEIATSIFTVLALFVIGSVLMPEHNQHRYKLRRVEAAWIFDLVCLPNSFYNLLLVLSSSRTSNAPFFTQLVQNIFYIPFQLNVSN